MGAEMIEEREYLEARAEEWESARPLTRRQILKLGAFALPVVAGAARVLTHAGPARAAVAPIVKPLPADLFTVFGSNAEMKWSAMESQWYTTPNDRFFVRNHTSTPTVDPATYALRVFGSGLAGVGATFTLDQLRAFPAKEITAFIECAGNGRSYFATQQNQPAPGTQWGLGAVGVARWRGVPLAEVLERAGITKQAVDVMPQGLDNTVVVNGVDAGHVRRPLPVAKALEDALLAYEMNGEGLPPDHGYPLRLVVPGWVGVANIKWVGQIEVSNQPLFSVWNTLQYRLVGGDYPADSPPLSTQVVKSAFELAPGAQLPAHRRTRLTGRSWSGTSVIARVDVSIDHGATWIATKLHGQSGAGSWSQWTFDFPAQSPGSYELWARARDKAGRVQPPTVPFNTNGYLFGGIVRHPVVVR
jgi:DMSO/TMAO reductase YedYZ molybdopterin-dependent catalytic subunit